MNQGNKMHEKTPDPFSYPTIGAHQAALTIPPPPVWCSALLGGIIETIYLHQASS